MAFSVEIDEQHEGVFVVIPDGRLDGNVHHIFREKIEPLLVPATRILIFDMSRLQYISSAGLAVIFMARKVVEKNQGYFIITGLQPQVQKIFEVIKDWPETSVFRTMEEVDNYLDAIQTGEIKKYPKKMEGLE